MNGFSLLKERILDSKILRYKSFSWANNQAAIVVLYLKYWWKGAIPYHSRSNVPSTGEFGELVSLPLGIHQQATSNPTTLYMTMLMPWNGKASVITQMLQLSFSQTVSPLIVRLSYSLLVYLSLHVYSRACFGAANYQPILSRRRQWPVEIGCHSFNRSNRLFFFRDWTKRANYQQSATTLWHCPSLQHPY